MSSEKGRTFLENVSSREPVLGAHSCSITKIKAGMFDSVVRKL